MGTLKKGEELLVLGAPKIANDKWEGWLLDFHKNRIKNGVSMRIIYNSNAKEYGARQSPSEIVKCISVYMYLYISIRKDLNT